MSLVRVDVDVDAIEVALDIAARVACGQLTRYVGFGKRNQARMGARIDPVDVKPHRGKLGPRRDHLC
jgi:hypothetical protein